MCDTDRANKREQYQKKTILLEWFRRRGSALENWNALEITNRPWKGNYITFLASLKNRQPNLACGH